MAGLAGGAEVISTPESEVPASEIAQRLRAAFERGKTHAIVVIAESVKENAAKILAYFDTDKQRTGFELRATTLVTSCAARRPAPSIACWLPGWASVPSSP